MPALAVSLGEVATFELRVARGNRFPEFRNPQSAIPNPQFPFPPLLGFVPMSGVPCFGS